MTSFTVTCPPGYAATSGGAFTPAPGTIPLKSFPLPSGAGWTFKFINKVGNPAGKVTVVVFCTKALKTKFAIPMNVFNVVFKVKPSMAKLGPIFAPSVFATTIMPVHGGWSEPGAAAGRHLPALRQSLKFCQ